MPLVEWLSSMWEISFPAGRGGHGGEDVLLLEVEVAPVLGALERLQRHRWQRRICKFNSEAQNWQGYLPVRCDSGGLAVGLV